MAKVSSVHAVAGATAPVGVDPPSENLEMPAVAGEGKEIPDPESDEQTVDRVFPEGSERAEHSYYGEEEQQKRRGKRGRPPDPERTNAPHLPKPTSFRMKLVPFFAYCSSTDKKFPGRITGYVYRTWPVTDRVRCGRTKYIDKISEFSEFAEAPLQEILHRYGSGNYKFILNDAITNKEIAQCIAVGDKDGLNDRDHPPLVNLDELELSHPSNADFVNRLRREGVRLPGDAGFQSREQEDEDMGQEGAVSKMAEVITDMAGQLVETAKDSIGRKSEGESPQQMNGSAISNISQALTDGFRGAQSLAVDVIKDAVAQAQAITKSQNDPMAMVETLTKLVKTLVPATPVPGAALEDPVTKLLMGMMESYKQELSAMRGMMAEVTKERIANLERSLQMQQTGAQQTAAGVGLAPVRPVDEMERMVNTYQKMRELFGGGESEERNPGRGSSSLLETLLPMALPLIGSVLGGINVLVHNWAVAKTGTGQPVAPPPPMQLTPEQVAAMSGQQPEIAGAEIADQAASTQGDERMKLNPYYFFLRKLERPLLEAINRGDTGDVFAESMIGYEGQMAYDVLKEAGKEQLIQILRTYPPIWSVVVQIPQKFDKFLDDFLAYEEIVKREEAEEQAASVAGQTVIDPSQVMPPRKKVAVKRAEPPTVEATAQAIPPTTIPAQ